MPPFILTVNVLLVMGGIALLGIAQSVPVAAVITVLEIAGLLFVIVRGLGVAEHIGGTARRHGTVGRHVALDGGLCGLSAGLLRLVGFEDMANVAEAVKDLDWSMPRAIFRALIVATLLYSGTATAVLV